MLDRTAGTFQLGPSSANVPSHRRYLPGSLVHTLDYALIDSPQDYDIDASSASAAPRWRYGKDDDKNGYVDDTYGWNVI
jgi:hypothetical protein